MIKSLVHNALHCFGLDIVRVENLEAELTRREKQRLAARILELEQLRSQTKTSISGSAGVLLWVNREDLMPEAAKHMQATDVVLDIGCAFRPQQYITAKTHICCEPFHEYMHRLMVETAGDTRFVYLKADATAACELFPAGSVDTAFMNDVIEHIDREVGQRVLQGLKQIVRRQIVVFTPLGYMHQDPSDAGVDPWGMGGVEWQKHRSGWTPDDFPPSEGWQVIACRDFHQVDGYDRPMNEPVGAFWAIWNKCS